jgi:hypothetical protein
MRREVKSGERIQTRARRRPENLFFFKPVLRVHDASQTIEETQVAAASCNEDVKKVIETSAQRKLFYRVQKNGTKEKKKDLRCFEKHPNRKEN